jgi:HEAT repeat protein
VRKAIRRLGFRDIAMEEYLAEGRPPLTKCLEDVGRSDIYLGLFAWRYGFTPPGSDRSITEAEYREAVRLGKPCLIFILAEEAPWPVNLVDRGSDGDQILALRQELAEMHVCHFFTSTEDLTPKVAAALIEYRDGERRQAGMGRLSEALSDEVLAAYYKRLDQNYRWADLEALTLEASEFPSIPLADIFVEPTAYKDASPEPPRDWWQRAAGSADSDEAVALRESYQAKPSAPLFDIVADLDHRALVLLGDPGAGKSTVARHLALTLAGSHQEPRLAALAGYLPVLIEMRTYVSHMDDPQCGTFLDYLDHRHDRNLSGIKKDLLLPYLEGGGKALFLFDGLDEIFEPGRREEVASQIAALSADFPAVRVLVTSRIIGYTRGKLTDAGFTHFTIDDFGDAQIDQFLRGWCPLALPGRPAAAASQLDRILDAIRTSSAIRELAGNPLLLTILAIVARDKPLPQERWRLYDHAADVLIRHWDFSHQLRPDYGSLTPLARKELLRQLAFRMQTRESGGNYIELEDLLRVLEDNLVERLGYAQDWASTRAQAMVDHLCERNFILSQYGPDLYGFVHRTFLEFFCAEAIVEKFQRDEPDMTMDRLQDLFRQHWAEPSWREVLRLVVGRLPARHADALITLLATEVNTPWPPEEFTDPPWNLALAVQCMAEVRTPGTVVAAARVLLRQLILLIEHGVSIEDRNTVELTEAEILPAIRVVGTRWPGREIFLRWYRRRGVRVSWTAGSSFATRVAVMLATPEQGLEDFLDTELRAANDRRALLALVAGLAEAAGLADQPERSGGPARRERCRVLLTALSRADEHGAAIRLAALHALVSQFGAEPQTIALAMERAGSDASGAVQLLAIETLSARGEIGPALRALLLDRARDDREPQVRRAAVEALGKLRDDAEVQRLLSDRMRTDTDPGVLQAAFRALSDRPGTAAELRELLVRRAGPGPYDAVRRTAVRLLSESYPDVHDLLVQRIRDDPDPRTRGVAMRELIRTAPADADLWKLLVRQVVKDDDADPRTTALRFLVQRHGDHPALRTVLSRRARKDSSATVRLAAVQELVRLFCDTGTVEILLDLADTDSAAGVRLAATQALAEHFGAHPQTRALIKKQAAEERDTIVRLAAIRALIRIGPASGTHECLLSRVALDSNPQVVRQAATELINWRDRRDEVATLLTGRAREDSYGGIRLVAIDLLVSRFGAQTPDTLLLELAGEDSDPAVLQTVGRALIERSADPTQIQQLLVIRADDGDPSIRQAAVTLLGDHFGTDPQLRDLLVTKARKDTDPQVRRAAAGRLGTEAVATQPGVRAVLIDLIDDSDWSIRRIALHALGEHFGGDPEVRALIIDRARDDPSAEFRRLAGQTLTWLPGTDPDDLPNV